MELPCPAAGSPSKSAGLHPRPNPKQDGPGRQRREISIFISFPFLILLKSALQMPPSPPLARAHEWSAAHFNAHAACGTATHDRKEAPAVLFVDQKGWRNNS